MKNKEKFAKEIIDIACNGRDVAVCKSTGKPIDCVDIVCSKCSLAVGSCTELRKEWAESEYIEKPVISKRDREFLEHINCNYKYIARDMRGGLCVFLGEPRKMNDCWVSTGEMRNGLKIFNIDFPMIEWGKPEPWSIEDLKKLEVVEEYENN